MSSRIGGYPITEVVKNLIIINVLFFIATDVVDVFMTSPVKAPFSSLKDMLGLHYFQNNVTFRPFQLVTSMFTHGGIMHFAFNMMTLFFLGPMIENRLGAKRFLLLYLISGLGASVLHTLGNYTEVASLTSQVTPENLEIVKEKGYQVLQNGQYFNNPALQSLNLVYNNLAVGASGCISGVIMALGMLFPNVQLYLMFIPAPIKAKYIALGSVVISLIFGILNFSSDPIAHFAHLGGLLTGYIILRIWKEGYLLK